MKVPVRSQQGEELRQVELSPSVFNVSAGSGLLHQTLVRQQANLRQGTADSKTRGDVAGSTRKLYRQKGTGRARQGSVRAPHRKGSGIAFGPHPRSFAQDMPKKMRRRAMLAALSAKAKDGEITLIEGLSLPQPKTKDMVAILQSLGLEGTVLLIMGQADINVVKSARNLPGVKTLPASLLNIGDLLSYRHVVMTTEGLNRVQELWGQPGEPAAVLVEAPKRRVRAKKKPQEGA